MNYDAGMKRPRMEGPPGPYGGPPGPGGPGGYGAPGPYGMGPPPGMMEGPPGGYMGGPEPYGMGGPGMMGAGGPGAGFPCVKLRGLPFDVSEEDIRMFLGLEPVDVVLVKRDGRLTGEAFVVLGNAMHIEMALQKNRSYMGRRYIEIYRAKKIDYYRAVVSEVENGGPGLGGRDVGGRPPYGGRDEGRFAGPPGTEGFEGGYGGPRGGGVAAAAAGGEGGAGTTILKLRGLPFQVSDDDICAWFNNDTSLGISPVVKDNVLVVMDNGRPSGIAFVEFPSPQEATHAMGKNKQMMGTRYIEIFPANRADLDRCR